MKAGWASKPLVDVATVRNGGTPKSKVPEYWGDDVEWLTPKDMGKMDGIYISNTPRKISELGLSKCSAKLAPENSVIMSTRAPIGHLAINTVAMAFNQGCRAMTPNDDLDTKYLFYFLSGNVPKLNDLGSGTTFKELSAGALKSFQIPIAPLEEQKRIVSVLDAAFEGLDRARAHTEANLQNARDLFESYIQLAFKPKCAAYDQTTLGASCSFTNGKAHEKDINEEGKYKVVNSKFVSTEGRIFKRTNKIMSPLKKDDIALVMSDVPKGKALAKAYLIETDNLYSLNQRICKISSENYVPEFLFFQLNRNPFLLAFDNKGSQANLRKSEVLSCPLDLPPKDIQRQLAIEATEMRVLCNSVINQAETKLIDLDDLRQSLLQKAFAGELT